MVIGLAGFDRVGKSTLAKKMAAELREATVKSFATPLKLHVANKNNITVEELNVNKEKYRKELIREGTRMRDEDPYYFVDKADRSIDSPITIFDDLRFVTEQTLCDVTVMIAENKKISESYELSKLKDVILIGRDEALDTMGVIEKISKKLGLEKEEWIHL